MTNNKKCTAPAATDTAQGITNTQSIPHGSERCQAYKLKIITHLDKHGFRHSLIGFEYIIRAIELTLESKSNLIGITKFLYPNLAKEFNSTPQRVERAIRRSIECSQHYEVTNKEFLALAADQIFYGG